MVMRKPNKNRNYKNDHVKAPVLQRFPKGMTVVLKSGGPPMTVYKNDIIQGQILIWCLWFAPNEKDVCTGAFNVETLSEFSMEKY